MCDPIPSQPASSIYNHDNQGSQKGEVASSLKDSKGSNKDMESNHQEYLSAAAAPKAQVMHFGSVNLQKDQVFSQG